MDNKKKKLPRALGTAAGVAVAAVTGAGALAVLPVGVQVAAETGLGFRKMFAKRWWKATCDASKMTDEEMAAEVEARGQEPAVAAVIAQSVQNLLDTTSVEVIPALGRLTAQYLRRGEHPDRFFRGAAGLLRTLDRQQVIELTKLLRLVKDGLNSRDHAVVRLAAWPADGGVGLFVPIDFEDEQRLHGEWRSASEDARAEITRISRRPAGVADSGDPRVLRDDGTWIRVGDGHSDWLGLIARLRIHQLAREVLGMDPNTAVSGNTPRQLYWAPWAALFSRATTDRLFALL